MKAVVSAIQSNLTNLSGRVDVALGYPKDGVDVGSGVHAPAAQSSTLRWALVFKHPTLNQWAYPVDGLDDSRLQASDRATVRAASQLASDWFTEA